MSLRNHHKSESRSHGSIHWFMKVHRIIKVSICRYLRLRRNTYRTSTTSCDSLLSFGKGWIVRSTTTRRLLYWANGLFYPNWN